MVEKRVSVRLAAVGGKQVRTELTGIGDAGKKGFGKASREMEIANAKLAKFARRAKIAVGVMVAAAAAAGIAMVRSSLKTIDEQAKLAASLRTGNAPAYRGTAYVMFEALDLTAFGNRIPQLSFEVFRPVDAPDTAEGLIKAVTMIPATGEFQYGTTPVSRGTGGNTASENVHTTNSVPDIIAALDQLQASAPHIESVSLVVSWFGLDLRAGNCAIQPGVESATKVTTPVSWAVNGLNRTATHQISLDANGKLAYGGTPSDATIVEASFNIGDQFFQ